MIPDLLALLWTQESTFPGFGKLPWQKRVAWYDHKGDVDREMAEEGYEVDYSKHSDYHMVIVDYKHISTNWW